MQHKDHRNRGSSPSDRIRRASYYVWFLGAEEGKGLRGADVVRPVVEGLLEKERDDEPSKVTLQVSARGIKIIQQGATVRVSVGSTKHFIPAGSLTDVQQEEDPEDDVVSTVMLIYNPITKCPVHVQAYRCDSAETASLLKGHLQQLILRPEQQEKLSSLENRLTSRGLLVSKSRSSEGTSSGSSVSSVGGGSIKPFRGDQAAPNLYDSLAQELREKLDSRAPILLPPKDYQKTFPHSIKKGPIPPTAAENDSTMSSGIGSDDANSPTLDIVPKRSAEGTSSSEEEWQQACKSQESQSPAPIPFKSNERNSSPSRRRIKSPLLHQSSRESWKYKERGKSPVSPRDRFFDARDKFVSLERQRSAGEKASPPPDLHKLTSWDPSSGSRRSANEYRDRGLAESPQHSMHHKDNVVYNPWNFNQTEFRLPEHTNSTDGGNSQVPAGRDFYHGVPQLLRTSDRIDYHHPESPHEYHRAKSMHDLSNRRSITEDDGKNYDNFDPRRHSLYSPVGDDHGIKKSSHESFTPLPNPIYGSYSHLNRNRPTSSCSSSSPPLHNVLRYGELPDNQHFPGLDRATARPDPIADYVGGEGGGLGLGLGPKRTFDYPVNGGHAPIQITRAHHDDYRRFGYDHGNTNAHHPAAVPAVPAGGYY